MACLLNPRSAAFRHVPLALLIGKKKKENSFSFSSSVASSLLLKKKLAARTVGCTEEFPMATLFFISLQQSEEERKRNKEESIFRETDLKWMVRWPSHSLTTAYSPLHSTILFIIIISCILLFLFLFFLKKKKKGAKETHSTCQTFWRSEDLSCFCLFLSSEEEEGGGPFSEGTTMSERRTKRPHCQCSCFLCVPLALGMRIENGKGIVPRHRDFGVWTPRHTQLTDKAVVKEEKETAVPLPICPILSSLTDWLTLYNRHRHLNCCSRRIPSLSVFFPCFCSFYFHPSIYRLLFCLCHRVTSLFSSPLYCVSVPPFVIAHGRCNCLLLYLFFMSTATTLAWCRTVVE